MKPNNNGLTPADAGCWYDSHRGVYIGLEVMRAAAERGWAAYADALESDDPTHYEYFCEGWESAEDFLNSMAPDGYWFGSNENGDCGLWLIESADDDDPAEPEPDEEWDGFSGHPVR